MSTRGALPLAAACAFVACSSVDADRAADPLGVEASALRPDSPNTDELPPVFGPNEKVERLDSAGGSFRVHFSRQGPNAVPPADTDSDGIPDYVQLVAAEYDKVGDFYASELGFDRPPSDGAVPNDDGGDARFDVYLVDFSTSSDGSFRAEECDTAAATHCPGYMKQENDFAGHNYASLALATRILASHEYFHAVQAGYDAKAGANVNEATAVWASEQYDPTLDDLEGFVSGYLDRPDRGLTQEPVGPVDAFSYGSSLFFQFLGERYGRETIRQMWEALRDDVARSGANALWINALDTALMDAQATSVADAFAEFSRWNLFTAGRADPDHAYASGQNYPELKTKAVTLPFEDTAPRVFPLAAKFYSARAGEAGAYELALRSDAAVDGLRLLLARATDGQIAEVREARAEDTSSVRLEKVGSSDTIFAAVINTRTQGESLRPDVCLGTAGDVKDCAEKGSEPATDAGEGDSRAPAHESDGGCSVSAPGSTGTASSALWLLVAALISCRRWLQGRRPVESPSPAPRSLSSETSTSPASRPSRSTLRSET